jgi:hypothetical protein
MPRSLWIRVASLLACVLAVALAAPPAPAQQVDPRTRTVYVACYAYTIGQSNSVYLPVVRATKGEMYEGLEGKVVGSVTPGHGPGYTANCKTGDTPEAAEAARIKSGYVKTSELPWPKDVVLASMSPASKQPAPPAGPPKWASCYLETSGGVGTSLAFLVFEPFRVAAEKASSIESGIGSQFHGAVGVGTVVAGYHPFASFDSDHCSVYDSEEAARAKFVARTNVRGYNIIKTVSWTPPSSITGIGGAQGVAKVTGSSGGKGPAPDSAATVVKADTSIRDASKAWDEQVKKTLAAEAQKKVETAAKAAQADAKYKAQVEAFFAERRGQGRAQ